MTGYERFEQIYRDEAHGVLIYARYRVGPMLAEDVVAETFSVAWQKLERVPDPPRPWLLATARRVSANHLRAQRSRLSRETTLEELITIDSAAADSSTDAIERRHDVIAALKTLTPRDREAVLLVTWHDLTNVDAATVMECSVTAFAVRLHRARRRLARLLRNRDSSPAIATIAEGTR